MLTERDLFEWRHSGLVNYHCNESDFFVRVCILLYSILLHYIYHYFIAFYFIVILYYCLLLSGLENYHHKKSDDLVR